MFGVPRLMFLLVTVARKCVEVLTVVTVPGTSTAERIYPFVLGDTEFAGKLG